MAGLWIRSQDKAILGKFDLININYSKDTQIIGWSGSVREEGTDSYMVLGEYETNDRALQVLDEIQKQITTSITYAVDISENEHVTSAYVYQMPEE
jgi:hypothetical protein